MAVIDQLSLRELNRVVSIINPAVNVMKISGIDQWDEKYPDKEILHSDIVSQSMYGFVEEDNVIGLIVLNENQYPAYHSAEWKLKSGKILSFSGYVWILCIKIKVLQKAWYYLPRMLP